MEPSHTTRQYFNDTYLFESKGIITKMNAPDPSKPEVIS